MRGVVYTKEGRPKLQERPRPKIQKDTDVIVRVTMTTICSSDITRYPIFHAAPPVSTAPMM